ncbi:hypothetical protein [Paraglaciecola arctica]|uniref:hypothetical protein n=1 Tax=Paraglaciecola arctica TaxID=1128911 RepID=UPI001C0680CF|nr:hypothetical protein [Paraglaciecola arctica]MBU3006013.1 hypothetical protein [Paraglaciecola arctica]
MLPINYRLSLVSLCIPLFLVTACGESDKIADEILEEIETDSYADIAVVNTLDRAVSIHVKSELFNRDVFNSDFKELEVLAEDVSDNHRYEWVSDNDKTDFAIQDANNGENRASKEVTLDDKEDYWVIAWQDGQSRAVDIFEKEQAPEADKYKVRVFADGAYTIAIAGADIASSTQGEVSGGYSITNCDELSIAGTDIDLCTIGTAGKSYLVTYIESGTYFISQE